MTRLARRRTVVFVAGAEVVMAIAVVAIGKHGGAGGGVVVLIPVFLGAGLVVAYNRPHHRMGWMLLGVSGFLLLSGVGASYSLLDYRDHHGQLPLGPLAVLIEPTWAPAIALLVLSILLYPDGRLPSRRWRWPVRALVVLSVAWQAGAYAIAADAIITGRISVDSSGDLNAVNQPTGGWAWWGLVQTLFFLTVALILVSWLVSQATGYRRLRGERRVQQKWILGGAAVAALGMIAIGATVNSTSGLGVTIGNIAPVGLVALPISICIGILRYRLYEIDRLVSRTVAYAIVTALLVGTFVGLVALSTDVLAFSSSVGVAASTLAAAALFNPLRVRVQRVVDRRFNRARYDAEATVAAFSTRLRDAVDLEAIQADLLATVQRAVEPAHASVWIRGVSR